MKRLILLNCLFLVACATSHKVSYNITSDPVYAQIDVNGVSMGLAPVEITLECNRAWVGLMNSPDGWTDTSGSYQISAYPPKGYNGQSQMKLVNPCQWKGGGSPTIAFDLDLRLIAPTQTVELISHDKNASNDLQSKLNALKILRDSGVLSRQEYKNKALELIEK